MDVMAYNMYGSLDQNGAVEDIMSCSGFAVIGN